MTTAAPLAPRTSSLRLAIEVLDEENPWPGLEAFREEDVEVFYGREAEADALSWEVQRARLTVLFGVSGLGKTSLLRAGLFPRLREQRMVPVNIRLDYSTTAVSLSEQVRSAVTAEASARGIPAPSGDGAATLWEWFHQRAHGSGDHARPIWALAFDQFEELFTLGGAAAREWAREELADLIEGRVPRAVKRRFEANPGEAARFDLDREFKVLLTLREDFLPHLEELRDRIPSLVRNRQRLRKLNGAQALEIVRQPRSRRTPPLVPQDVAPDVVRFVAGTKAGTSLDELEVDPTLLSLLCRELNIRRQTGSDRSAQISRDLLQGSAGEILTDFYERSLRDEAPGVRRLIEEALLTRAGFRDSVAVENALGEPDVTEAALDRLVNRRLLRAEMWGTVRRLELTHDVLTGVVRASRDARRTHEATVRAEEAQRDAAVREEAARQKLRLGRVLVGSGIIIGLAAITAMIVSMTFVVPYTQQILAQGGARFMPLNILMISLSDFIGTYYWVGLVVAAGYFWLQRRRGVPRPLQLAAGPVIALVTILSLVALISISFELVTSVSDVLVSAMRRREVMMSRFAESERAIRVQDYQTAISHLDSIYLSDVLYRSPRARTYNRLLAAEAYSAQGDTSRATKAFGEARKEAKEIGDSWIRLVEESHQRHRPRNR